MAIQIDPTEEQLAMEEAQWHEIQNGKRRTDDLRQLSDLEVEEAARVRIFKEAYLDS